MIRRVRQRQRQQRSIFAMLSNPSKEGLSIKEVDFIKKVGLVEAKQIIKDAPDNAIYYWEIPRCKFGVYSSFERNQGRAINLIELVKLLKALDLVDLLGGIDVLNALIQMSNSPFALSHITREGVIFSIEEIRFATNVFDSIYGEKNV